MTSAANEPVAAQDRPRGRNGKAMLAHQGRAT
jgi:hypothetical protein